MYFFPFKIICINNLIFRWGREEVKLKFEKVVIIKN